MPASILEKIILRFRAKDDLFVKIFPQWIKILGFESGSLIALKPSEADFYPKIQLDFFGNETEGVVVDFALSKGEIYSLRLANTTGESRQSPHIYSLVKIEEVIHRLVKQGITLVGMDHVGCNLPWFTGGLHPQINDLRDKLLEACLYHQFPSGEAWDFIIPGDREEIERIKPVDYSQTRRPKFEIVSFEKSSTPLVQLDVQLNASYEALLKLFPEALNDPDLRNLWIYLENPYGIDLCIVANEFDEQDWSEFFKNSRITKQVCD